MKKFTILITLFCIFSSLCSLAQEAVKIDVVYLKDGYVYKGKILDSIPGEKIKFQNVKGWTLQFWKDEVDRIEQETVHLLRKSYVLYKTNHERKIPKKFSKKYYYVNITETNYTFSKARYEDGILTSSKLKYSFGLQTINGIKFCKKHFLGFGFGLNFPKKITSAKGQLNGMPYFLDYRYYILGNKKKLYCSLSVGVFKSGGVFQFKDVNYLPFLNPSIGLSFRVSPSVSANLSLGYSFYMNYGTIYTDLYYQHYLYKHYFYYNYYYTDYENAYPYQTHSAWNNKHCMNLKFGFVF
jgi:hypothetical protein